MEAEEFNLIIEPGRIEKNYWSDFWRYQYYIFTNQNNGFIIPD